MSVPRRRKIVVLGMMTRMPVPGVLWQTLHYLVGFRRLGYDVTYVEAHARAPTAFCRGPGDPGSAAAARFLQDLLSGFGLGGRWAYHALHHDGACLGMEEARLMRAYRSAAAIVNLHGGTRPRPEHTETGRLVYLGTDPVRLEIELWQQRPETRAFLDAHCAVFSFGENYGRPGCELPVSDRYTLRPTRQPVVLDFWENAREDRGVWTTVANWRQRAREIRYRKEVYHWSKDREFTKLLDLPARSGRAFELALSSFTPADRARLEDHGWKIVESGDFGRELEPYRGYIMESRGEFTVAKDQNVRLRSGWFSDRSATYLAAGRPVITQETGFSELLPTGEGLFGFTDMDDVLSALDLIETDYPRACRAARDVARASFDYRVVLPRLLHEVGVEGPCPATPVDWEGLPGDLVLEPASRRPLRMIGTTMATLSERPVPGGARDAGCAGPQAGRDDTIAASVIVVTWENLPLTRLCLETVLAHTEHPSWELVVVDNGSSDGTPDYLAELGALHPRVRLVLNPGNEGFAAACNVGADVAVGDLLVFLNNDTVVAPGWLTGLARALDDPGVGAVNPVTNRIGTEAEVGEAGATLGEFLDMAAERRARCEAEVRPVRMLAFFCLALRRHTWDAVGPLDEGFGRGLFEDDDYSARLTEAGYGLACAQDVLVHHLGEAAFGRLVTDGTYGRLFDDNRRRFEEKWGRRWRRATRAPDDGYAALVSRVRDAVADRLPAAATVAVVSRGDDALLDLGTGSAWHFPRCGDGVWAGEYPADGPEAVAWLDTARRAGASHLLLPRPAFWWLDHYAELRHHLTRTGEEIMRTDDALLYRLGGHAAAATPRPVLIIGSPRSGTSVLTWALGQHPDLYPLEETVWFGRFHRGLSEAFELGSSRGELSHLSAMGIERETFFRAFGRTVDALIREHRSWPDAPVPGEQAFARARSPVDPKERWVDGTPENSLFVPALVELFPEARFVHLLREPRAVVRSLKAFDRAGGRRHTPSEAWAKWLRHVRGCVEAEQTLGPERVLRVLHRDLVASPETVVRACLDFVGEAFSADCLLPLRHRINSSGTAVDREPSEEEPADPDLVMQAEALEAELFAGEEVAS